MKPGALSAERIVARAQVADPSPTSSESRASAIRLGSTTSFLCRCTLGHGQDGSDDPAVLALAD